MSSTPVTRAARRDYWNDPSIVRWARGADYALGLFTLSALLILGSIFN